ncbi:MAG: dethiobiotin synthase [Gammaproteobacteria bacterium]|nr:dethiobiotin synthase [Gammaproteobacteria bacterium]
MQRYFMIGTDTDCGKTYVTCQLLKQLDNAIAIKPIQSGGTEDADLLAKHQPHFAGPLSLYTFKPPIAPHIAAAQVSENITFDALDAFCHTPTHTQAKTLLIETTGGLMCPINQTQTWLDYIIHSQIPVIFVVGLRLGCLNHALLTAHALKTHHIPCVGWISNLCDPSMQVTQENLQTLKEKLPYKHLASVAFNGTIHSHERLNSFALNVI